MIRFVVALPAEARPLIDRYRLRRRQPAGPFPIYETGSIALIVSGVADLVSWLCLQRLLLSLQFLR